MLWYPSPWLLLLLLLLLLVLVLPPLLLELPPPQPSPPLVEGGPEGRRRRGAAAEVKEDEEAGGEEPAWGVARREGARAAMVARNVRVGALGRAPELLHGMLLRGDCSARGGIPALGRKLNLLQDMPLRGSRPQAEPAPRHAPARRLQRARWHFCFPPRAGPAPRLVSARKPARKEQWSRHYCAVRREADLLQGLPLRGKSSARNVLSGPSHLP